MKAALNGVLPCTARDGWVSETNISNIGWMLDNDQISTNLLDTLEKDIIPLFFTQPQVWEEHMRNARNLIINQFSTARMLQEYLDKLYL